MESQEQKSPAENKEVVFYSKAIKCRIANWREEKRDGQGRIERPEASIRFEENVKVTSDPDMIAFIRASSAFENGDVIECEGGIEEAQKLRMQRAAVKYGPRKDETAEFIERRVITEGT